MYRILDTIAKENGKGAVQAMVMYKTYISFTQLLTYQKKMEDIDLIKVNRSISEKGKSVIIWDITPKGYVLMDKLKELSEILPNIL